MLNKDCNKTNVINPTSKEGISLEYVLKAIPNGCTISVVDISPINPKCLCIEREGFDPSIYEVISLKKYVLGNHVDYSIRVLEFDNNDKEL